MKQNEIKQNNELGRKVYFWYRVFLGLVAIVYCFVFVFCVLLAYFSQFDNSAQSQENLVAATLIAITSIPFAIVFAIGIFLPRKSWNWVVGFVYMAMSVFFCCFLPAVIPLIFFWIKPETQAYFGRK